jgi:hypothetical protein
MNGWIKVFESNQILYRTGKTRLLQRNKRRCPRKQDSSYLLGYFEILRTC